MAVSSGTSTQNQMTEKEMATDVKKYHVVQFLELPYKDIKKYVCVPTSWILLWNVDDEEVRVAYPIEDPAITKKRVENEERVGPSWESYLAVIKYSSGLYDTADFWIDTTPPWNDALGDIPLVISIDDSSTDDPDVAATQSNTTSKESSNKQGTFDAAAAESKPPDISQQNDSNSYGDVPQKEAMKTNLTLLSPKKEIDDKTIKEETIDPEYDTTDDWCNRIQIQAVTGTCNTENDSETSDNKKYSDIEIRPSNEKDITSAIPTSHIQVQEAPKRINKERICVVSEAYLFQGKKETVQESNDNDLPSPQNSPENKSAVQTLIDFVNKQKSDFTPHVQGVSTSIVNETIKPHTQTIDGSEVNHIWHKSHPKNATKNTPTAIRNSNPANDSCEVPKRSQRNQNVSAKDKTNLNPITDVLDFTAPTSDNTPKDSLDDVNEIINADLQERPADYDIRIERNSYVNRIIITRSAEMEYSVKAPQTTTKDKTPEKSNTRQMSKSSSKKPLPPAPTEHLRRDPRLQNAIVRATTGGQPLDLKKDFGNLAKRNQAMTKKPNAEQKVSQVSNGINFSRDYQNSLQKVSRKKRSLARSTTVSVCVDPNAAVQTTMRHTPFAAQNPGSAVNQVRHISELPYPNHSGLVFKACLLQDPRTGVIYLDPPAKPNSYNPRSSVHSMQNILSDVPNVQSLPPAEKQWTPDYRNHTLSTLQGTNQTVVRGPLEINNANHRPYVQNTLHTPPAVRNSNSAADGNCSSLCQYHGPFLPAHSYQEPRIQETMLRKSTEANCRQLSCSEVTDNRATAVINSTKPNQQKLNGNTNSVQSSPVHINYSNQPQETPIEINKNTVEESGYQRKTLTVPSSAPSTGKPSQPLKEEHSQNANSLNKEQLKRFSDNRARAEKQILDNLERIFTKINANLDERYKLKNDDIICDNMTKYNETIIKAMVMVTEHCDMKMKALLSKSKPLETIRKRHCDDDDGTNDSDNQKEPPKKKRYQRRMILPPEYNPKNSRWTLKHKTASPELVELFPRSRVYVNEEKLSRITRTAQSCTALARQLLLEIFSKSALSVCSLTGARARVTDPEGVNVRPGLDERARMVLFNFIEDHRIKKGWPKNDMAIILTLRSKLSECRRI